MRCADTIPCSGDLLFPVYGSCIKGQRSKFALLLTNLADAAENRTKWGPGNDAADLDAIRAISMTDYAIAESIANYWEEVYLKPNYRLFLYGENDDSAVPLRSVIPDRKTHAIAVLGYELKDGGMRPPSGQALINTENY